MNTNTKPVEFIDHPLEGLVDLPAAEPQRITLDSLIQDALQEELATHPAPEAVADLAAEMLEPPSTELVRAVARLCDSPKGTSGVLMALGVYALENDWEAGAVLLRRFAAEFAQVEAAGA